MFVTNSQSLPKLMSQTHYPNSLPKLTKHWVGDAIQPSHPLVSPSLLCLQSFPASGSFQMSQLFTSGGQSIGVSASASVLPMNIQDWFTLGWTGWIFLLSKEDLLGRKAMTNLDSILKCRGITLPTMVHIGKVMVCQAVMYGCESWTIKMSECLRTDAFELWCWKRFLRVPWTARRSNQSILKEINPEYS